MSQQPYGQMSMKPERGTLILVLGILSIVVCQILGPVAWLMGSSDLKEIRSGQRDPAGEQMTNVGRILGIIGTVLFCLSFVFGILWIILAVVITAGSAAAS